MATMTEAVQGETLHMSYLEHSPSYAEAHAAYGPFLPYAVAERFARQHGTSLDALAAEGLDLYVSPLAPPMVGLLDLYLTLGY
jgi:hypothetical protein